jgi:hypothetical protein
MIIKIILLILLGLMGYQIFLKRNKLPVQIFTIFILLIIAIIFVIFPEVTNNIAHLFGVGRGADLITYLFETAIFFIIIHYFSKLVEFENKMTKIVREIAYLKNKIEGSYADSDIDKKPHSIRSDNE